MHQSDISLDLAPAQIKQDSNPFFFAVANAADVTAANAVINEKH